LWGFRSASSLGTISIINTTRREMMSYENWIKTAVELTLTRMPHVTRLVAHQIADEIHETWPALTPEEAIGAYWDAPVC